MNSRYFESNAFFSWLAIRKWTCNSKAVECVKMFVFLVVGHGNVLLYETWHNILRESRRFGGIPFSMVMPSEYPLVSFEPRESFSITMLVCKCVYIFQSHSHMQEYLRPGPRRLYSKHI
jgi:hypothetical protein